MKELVERNNIAWDVDSDPLMNNYVARKSLPFLPSYVIEIINNLYTFYFIFIVPKKINKKDIILRLYSLYFESLSQVYPSILMKLGDSIFLDRDNYSQAKMDIYQGQFGSEHLGLYPVFKTVRLCKIIGIEKQLYNVLDQLWLRNNECCVLLYGLHGKNASSKKISGDIENKAMVGIPFNGYTINNEIITQIHLKIDSYIDQQEKEEKEGLF